MKKKADSNSSQKIAAPSPEAQLRALISRLGPPQQKLVQSLRAALRRRFPSATELAYDYPKQIVIAYSPNSNGIDGVVSIAAHADWVDMHLNNGPQLEDPKKLLLGSGKMTRFVRIDSADQLSHPDIVALIESAVAHARVPMPAGANGGLLIKTSKAGGVKKSAPKKGKKAKKSPRAKARAKTRK